MIMHLSFIHQKYSTNMTNFIDSTKPTASELPY
jgi:hypothetical protein